MPEYSGTIWLLFNNAHTYMGMLDGAHAEGLAGSNRSGPFMHFMVQISAGRIQSIKFRTHGCVPAHAAGVFLSGLALGKTVEEIEGKWDSESLIAALGGLPQERRYIATLSIKAFDNLIENMKKYRYTSESP